MGHSTVALPLLPLLPNQVKHPHQATIHLHLEMTTILLPMPNQDRHLLHPVSPSLFLPMLHPPSLLHLHHLLTLAVIHLLQTIHQRLSLPPATHLLLNPHLVILLHKLVVDILLHLHPITMLIQAASSNNHRAIPLLPSIKCLPLLQAIRLILPVT